MVEISIHINRFTTAHVIGFVVRDASRTHTSKSLGVNTECMNYIISVISDVTNSKCESDGHTRQRSAWIHPGKQWTMLPLSQGTTKVHTYVQHAGSTSSSASGACRTWPFRLHMPTMC